MLRQTTVIKTIKNQKKQHRHRLLQKCLEEDMIFEDIDQKDTSKEGGLGNTSRRSTVLFIIFQVVLVLVLVAAAMEAQRRIRLYLFKKRERDLKGRRRTA